VKKIGIFDKLFSGIGTGTIVKELLDLKSKISDFPKYRQTGTFTFGAGISQAHQQIQTICAVIDDAVKALKTGLDVHNRPITRPQIADGLKRLANATRETNFYELMETVFGYGVAEFYNYMKELEQIANRIK
jgi:hypothetical protein